jgi:hypothetical protein
MTKHAQNPSPAQTEQTNKPEIDFSHRAYGSMDGNFFNLYHSVQPALKRAAAVADLIEVACETADVSSFRPDTLWRAAQAIRFEIEDAQAMLDAYNPEKKAEAAQ